MAETKFKHLMNKNVIVLRGVSGSGKSTFANLIAEPKVICCADDFFMDSWGLYNFDVTKLGAAHKECQLKFEDALFNPHVENIVVANTNVKEADFKYYVKAAEEFGARVTVVVIEKRHDNTNVHSVPQEVLDRQYESLKASTKLFV